MSMFSGSARTGRTARRGLIALILTALFSTSTPTRAQSGDTLGDYGDAPDTTNHHGHAMYAYPMAPSLGALAHFPTVVDPAAGGPQGPWHRYPNVRSWLGTTASSKEANADQAPDADGGTNIFPTPQHHGLANYDRDEVGTLATGEIDLPACGLTSFSYVVSGAPAAPGHHDYVNVWFDWNRDGDWGDTIECTTAKGQIVVVYEWAVQNQFIPVAPGANTIMTPPFFSHAGEPEHLWMRISVAEAQAPQSSYDGSGPPGGYLTGEVTDLLMRPSPVAAASKQTTDTGNGDGTYEPEVAFYHNY